MQESKNHHYVPIFYLKRWAQSDGRIYSIKNINGKIAKKRRSPEYSGFEVYLYSYHKNFSSENRAEIETKFFKPLDTHRARITEKILRGDQLSRKDSILFAQFIAATKVRVPENVALINSQVQETLLRELQAGQEEYARLRPTNGPETLVEWVRLSHPALIESVGVGQWPKIISNEKVLQSILLFKWHVVDFSKSKKHCYI